MNNKDKIIEYLLDLQTYYTSLSCNNINKIVNIRTDKRYKNDSTKQKNNIKKRQDYQMYIDDKLGCIENMIDKINNDDVKKIEIEF